MSPKILSSFPAQEVVSAFAAAFILLLTMPLIAVCALAMALTFRSFPLIALPRIGKQGNTFLVYKIRTLRSPDQRVGGKGPLDPRATRLSSLLRISAIDEIPQLINLIKGDMVICGPRAIMFSDIRIIKQSVAPQLFEKWYALYTSVKPGVLSSHAMVSRNSDQIDRNWTYRLELDIQDIETRRMSFGTVSINLIKAIRDVARLLRANTKKESGSCD